MSLWLALVLVAAGLLLLAVGGELLVRGAVSLAELAGLTPAVIGLTVVALGTSLPELVVSVVAGLRGQPDIAVGNVVGSNIFNLSFTAGLCALFVTIPIKGNVVRLEWPVMFLASVAFVVIAYDGRVNRLDAGAFLIALVVFIGYSIRIARVEAAPAEVRELAQEVEERSFPAPRPRLIFSLGATVVGLGLLVLGGRLLVDGSVRLAQLAGISERVIGLTIVAVGTSAPEVATTLVAVVRRHTDVAVANLIGSNIFNLLGILGLTGLIAPIPVSPEMYRSDVWWMLGIAVLIFPLMRTGLQLTRRDGALLFGAYVVYLGLLLR